MYKRGLILNEGRKAQLKYYFKIKRLKLNIKMRILITLFLASMNK
jgi:hypothetical protein